MSVSSTLPRLNGVLETCLYVADVEQSAQFYRDLFGFTEIDRGERLIALSVTDRQLLLLFKKRVSATLPVTPHDGNGELHLAFAIPMEELTAWETRLMDHGIAIEQRRSWDRGGVSLYFRDPDRHLIELATPGVWSVY